MLKFSIKNIIESNTNDNCLTEKTTDDNFPVFFVNNNEIINSETSTTEKPSIFFDNMRGSRRFKSHSTRESNNVQEIPNQIHADTLLSSQSIVPESSQKLSKHAYYNHNSASKNLETSVDQKLILSNKKLTENQTLLAKQSDTFSEFAAFQNFQIFQYQLLISNARLQNNTNHLISNDDIRYKLSNLLVNTLNNTNNNIISSPPNCKKAINTNIDNFFTNNHSIENFIQNTIREIKQPNNYNPSFQYPNLFNNNYSPFVKDSVKFTQSTKSHQDNIDILHSHNSKNPTSLTKSEATKRCSGDSIVSHNAEFDQIDRKNVSLEHSSCFAETKKEKQPKQTVTKSENHENLKFEQNKKTKRKEYSLNEKELSNPKLFKSLEKKLYKSNNSDKDYENLNDSENIPSGQEKISHIKPNNGHVNVNSFSKAKNYPCTECGKV
jgi:hypothetical protein